MFTTIFKKCPSCGGDAVKADSEKSIVCESCGFLFFFNAAAAVAAIIVNADNELLVAVRKNDPGKGHWDLPGGFVDPGESAEAALRREIQEELNLQVTSLQYFASAPNEYHYRGVTYVTVDMVFVCGVKDLSTLRARDDIADVLFVRTGDMDWSRFCFVSSRTIVQAFVEGIGDSR